MQKRIVTEKVGCTGGIDAIEIETIGNSMWLTVEDSECSEHNLKISAEQAADLADALIAAIEICYPDYMSSIMIEE